MKLFDEAAVREALKFPVLIDALEKMLLEGAETPPRHVHQIPVPNEADASLLLMPAWQVGGLIGVTVGLAIAYAATSALGWEFLPSAPLIVGATAFSALIGIGFGFFPARRAAQLNPIEALRFE